MDMLSARQILDAAAMVDEAVLMEGVHGIGKSQLAQQFSDDKNYHMETLFLSHQEVGDLIGIPHAIEIDGVMCTTWSVPIWLQRMRTAASEGKRCVLFLDEPNRAPLDVRQAALQLVLEGKIHEHELPRVGSEKTFIIAAINPPGDYQVDELDEALLDRFLVIKVEPDAPAWLDWARKANANIIVRDFIAEHPNRLHWTPADGGIGSSPRSWAKLGNFMEKVNLVSENIVFQFMKGKIGTEIASQFYSFFKNYVDTVKVSDIEKIVQDNKDRVDNITDIADIIADKIQDAEAVQKIELAEQLKDKSIKSNDMLVLLSYLYALEVEICVSFLQIFRKDDISGYSKLVKIDAELNNKELFKRIIQASEKI